VQYLELSVKNLARVTDLLARVTDDLRVVRYLLARATDVLVTVTDNLEAVKYVLAHVIDLLACVTDNLLAVTDDLGTVTDDLAAVSDDMAAVSDDLAAVTDDFALVKYFVASLPINSDNGDNCLESVMDNLVKATDLLGKVIGNLVTSDDAIICGFFFQAKRIKRIDNLSTNFINLFLPFS